MTATLVTAVKRYPVMTFVILAYAFSWWPWPLYALHLSPAPIIGFGPFFAALVVLAVTEGKPAVSGLLSQMIRWRVGLRWYAVALGLPLVLSGLAAALNVLLGAPAPSVEQLVQGPLLLPAFLVLLLVPGIGGTWEEPGWRGYALAKLAAGRSQMAAGLLLWTVIAGWHLPLLLTSIIPWVDLLIILGTVVIFNWVYYRTGGSVLIIMIFHAMNNAAGQYFPSLFTGQYAAQFSLLQGEIWLLIALCMVVVDWAFWTRRPASQAPAVPQVGDHLYRPSAHKGEG